MTTTNGSALHERRVTALERDILALIAENRPLVETLDALTLGLEKLAGPGTLASVLFVDEERRVLRHGSAPSLPDAYNLAIDGAAIGPAAGSCGTAAHRRQRVIVSDIATDPLWSDYRDAALPHGLRACWSQPILCKGGDVLGTVAFYYREPRAPTEEELETIDRATQLTRIVFERERDDRARARAGKREAAQYAAACVLAEAETVEAGMSRLVEAVGSALGWDTGSAWLVDAEHDDVRSVVRWARDPNAFAPFIEDTASCTLARGQGLPGGVVASGEPAWVSLEHPEKFSRTKSAKAVGLRVGFALPIKVGRETVGAIELFSARPEAPDPELLRALATVGLQAGQFLRRAREQEERERVVRELQETVRYSELFAGVLGHDLRNPLNALVMGAELLLQKTPEGDRNRATLTRMLTSGKRMGRMISQLLDLTRSRRGGGLDVIRAPCDLRELALHAASELRLAYPQQTLNVSVAGDAKGTWDGDRLSQVLSNLLGNAMTHGDPSQAVDVRIDATDASTVRIEIENAGTIAETDLPWLFDPFRSGRERSVPKQRGLGLGLYITNQIVLAHGGKVDVRSSGGRTVFCVSLPRTEP